MTDDEWRDYISEKLGRIAMLVEALASEVSANSRKLDELLVAVRAIAGKPFAG
jgi:hypothetical protein